MDFNERVWDSIQSMKTQYNYTPTIFINMINQYGVIEAVKRLINNRTPSSGYTKLWELNALNLSMEAIIQEEEWRNLFTDDERSKAKERLNKYGYEPPRRRAAGYLVNLT